MPTVTRSSKGTSSPCVARAQFHGQTQDPDEWCSALVVEDGHVALMLRGRVGVVVLPKRRWPHEGADQQDLLLK
jgi:hypothetical protein